MKTPKKKTAENFIKDIRRNTRRIFSSEQKIQIVMEALRAEMSVAELCRKYSINESQFYKWNKEFLEIIEILLSGKKYRSDFVSMQIEEIWENKAFVNELNRKILQYLAKGYKLKEIAQELDVSEITIKKRISKIRESLNLNEEDNILKEAKSRGYL